MYTVKLSRAQIPDRERGIIFAREHGEAAMYIYISLGKPFLYMTHVAPLS